jgi:hypothetical protein
MRDEATRPKISIGVKAYIKEHGAYRTGSKMTDMTKKKMSNIEIFSQ